MTSSKRSRLLTLVAILAAIALGLWFLFGTSFGRQWTDQRHVRHVVESFPTIAPLLFIAAYIVLACMMLPMWWMQGLAGYCFGPVWGIVYCQAGATTAAYVTVALAEWLTADMAMHKIEPVLNRLRSFQHRLGSTGIPLVMAVRLMHVIPFGPSNVAFGLMKMRPRDAAIGTLVGTVSGVGFCAVLGSAGPEFKTEWHQTVKAVAILLAINLSLATPLVILYLRRRGKLGNEGTIAAPDGTPSSQT